MSDSDTASRASRSTSTSTNPSKILHDVIIIGAGPCGLAVSARLCEHTPSAIFTEEEHSRYHWIRRHGQHANILQKRNYKSQDVKPLPTASNETTLQKSCYDTLVLDATAPTWMARWNYLFNKFEIEHLRSPMFFHVDPSDRDALLAFAHELKLQEELLEIRGCVGKEISKHKRKKRVAQARLSANERVPVDERDRKDYYVPSRNLFHEHCCCVVNRYGLGQDLISKQKVENLVYAPENDFPDDERVFKVETNEGTHFSRAVIVATGPGDCPNVPDAIRPFLPHDNISWAAAPGSFLTHSVKQKIKDEEETNVLIVGGGLTSAQIADLAIRRGVTKVWLLMRGHLKVKPFDVDLQWVGKFKNHEKSVFWSADSDEGMSSIYLLPIPYQNQNADESSQVERLEQIKKARNGGSVTPSYNHVLQDHIRHGTVSLLTHTQLESIAESPNKDGWTVTVSPSNTDLASVNIDHIYLATGKSVSYTNLPFLQAIARDYPIESCGGLPRLTEDLSWHREVPLFINGALAALRLGPGAGNLEGARVGAERIVWGIQEWLGRRDGEAGDGEEAEDGDDGLERYRKGIGGMFEGLAV